MTKVNFLPTALIATAIVLNNSRHGYAALWRLGRRSTTTTLIATTIHPSLAAARRYKKESCTDAVSAARLAVFTISLAAFIALFAWWVLVVERSPGVTPMVHVTMPLFPEGYRPPANEYHS